MYLKGELRGRVFGFQIHIKTTTQSTYSVSLVEEHFKTKKLQKCFDKNPVKTTKQDDQTSSEMQEIYKDALSRAAQAKKATELMMSAKMLKLRKIVNKYVQRLVQRKTQLHQTDGGDGKPLRNHCIKINDKRNEYKPNVNIQRPTGNMQSHYFTNKSEDHSSR